MGILNVLNKIFGKSTEEQINTEDKTAPIKFDTASLTPVPSRSFVANNNQPNKSVQINVPAGQYKLYDAAKNQAAMQEKTIVDVKQLDIVALIKERKEAVTNIYAFLKDQIGFPPHEQNQLYKYLSPTISSGENAGKINHNARYGGFRELQEDLVTYFDGSDDSKAHLLNLQQENQKILSLICWIIALKNFAVQQPDAYAKLISDLTVTNVTLANILVFLAECPATNALLSYSGSARTPEFRVMLEDAIRFWYQGAHLIAQS